MDWTQAVTFAIMVIVLPLFLVVFGAFIVVFGLPILLLALIERIIIAARRTRHE